MDDIMIHTDQVLPANSEIQSIDSFEYVGRMLLPSMFTFEPKLKWQKHKTSLVYCIKSNYELTDIAQ
jgi:hypothetical protein